jgi:acetyltransferase-like isoleucine patch superfamily enzyme
MAVPLATRVRDALRDLAVALRTKYLVSVWKMEIGEGTTISFSAKLDKTNPRGIHLGKYTTITFGAAILTHDYVNNRDADVRIGDNCFIGAHSIILPGVTIGDGCIISAASIVARDIPAGSFAAGNPARVLEKNIKVGHYGVREPVAPQPTV